MLSKKNIYRKRIKRILDIVLSISGIVLCIPLMLVVMLLVRCNLGSPVIFCQKRVGKNERIFNMYKFRTMTDKRNENGELLPDSDRLTVFGEKLRVLSLDELPELFNILKGDMSIIGPRPLLVEYLPYYSKTEKKRHTVRGGLTGLAQISGRNCLDWDERLGKDVEYVENISFKLDCHIFFKTIMVVLRHEDVAANSAEVETCLSECRSKHNVGGNEIEL